VTLVVDAAALAAGFADDKELQALLLAVQARGPAVGVTLARPWSETPSGDAAGAAWWRWAGAGLWWAADVVGASA
jgi:hypothetical protein